MPSPRIVTALVLGTTLFAACPDEDTGGGDTNLEVSFPDGTNETSEVSESYSFVELCDGYAAALCNIDRCIFPESEVSDEDCRRQTREVCEDTITGPIGTHIDGSIFYQPASASECIEHFAGIGCDAMNDATGDIPVACEEVFNGTLDVGAACTFDALCKPELFCKASAPVEPGETCSGTCAVRKLEGESCTTTDAICARGLICSAFSADDTGTCQKRKVALGDACVYGDQCPDGAYCDDTCKARVTAGNACAAFECAQGLTCFEDTCQTPPGLGEACESGCTAGLTCISGTCAEEADEGEPCVGEFNSCSFVKRLQCDLETDTCVKYFALGEACGGPNKPGRCDGGWCNATFDAPGTCVAFKSAGDACEVFSDECGRLSCLESGVCGPFRDPCRGPGSLAPF